MPRRHRHRYDLNGPAEPPVERRGRRARTREVLTDEYIDSLPSEEREYALHDCDERGLYVRVRPRGSKSFVYRPTVGPSRERITLGQFPLISTEEARSKARSIRLALANGRKPDEFSNAVKAHTVRKLVPLYIATFRGRSDEWKTRVRRTLERDFIPLIGEARVSELTPELALKACNQADSLYGRRHRRYILSSFLSWAVKTGRISRNVLSGTLSEPRQVRRREGYLDFERLARIWAASAQLPQPWQTIFRLLIATGAPIREILALRRQDVAENDLLDEAATAYAGTRVMELLADFPQAPGDYLFRGSPRRPTLAFQQKMLERLRMHARVGSFTCRDISDAVKREMPKGPDWQQRWDGRLGGAIDDLHKAEAVDL